MEPHFLRTNIMHTNDWKELINKFLDNKISREEYNQLLEKVSSEEDRNGLTDSLKSIWDSPLVQNNTTNWDSRFEAMMKDADKTTSTSPQQLSVNYKYLVSAFAIAASICILFFGYWFFNDKNQKQTSLTSSSFNIPAPDSSKAVITLSDGRVVPLDNLLNGKLEREGNINIETNSKGEIFYKATNGQSSQTVLYNTIYNPRGSAVVSLALNDGSRVWLNSESSLKYPVSFIGKTRQVELSGEAFFEVAHKINQLFSVKISDGTTIEDIGTSFNVNAYPEELSSKITLIEGSIKVNNKILKPGEQFLDNHISNDIDIEEVLAWKNGMFQLNGKTDIKTIMNQISKWYNVNVVYKGEIDKHFWGSIPRSANMMEVLKMLEATGSVHFKIEKDTIIVMP